MKRTSLIIKLTSICLFLLSNLTYANPAEQLNTLLSNFHAMSANFHQQTVAKKGVGKSSSGTMALERPGKFRWEIKQPSHQIIIADGSYLWIYDVDLEQATKKSLTKDNNSPAILLSGSTQAIEQRFVILDVAKKGDQTIFQLKPKANGDMFQRVDMIFIDDKLSQMAVIDTLGQKNIFTFTQVKLNPTLPKSLFVFRAAKGVDIIQD